MDAFKNKKEILKNRKTQYACDFLTVYEDDVTLPSGNEGTRVVVAHSGGAGVLPITREGHVLLVRQYRYAISEWTLEIPAGKLDSVTDDALMTAKRELEEETGHKADAFEKLTSIYTAIGFSDEKVDIFVAKDVYPVDNPVQADDEENITLEAYTREAALDMVKKGIIMDAKTALALLIYNQSFE